MKSCSRRIDRFRLKKPSKKKQAKTKIIVDGILSENYSQHNVSYSHLINTFPQMRIERGDI